jgi:hypothetical protein
MKKLSLFIAAGLFLVAFAGAAYASSVHEGWSSNSIDPSGFASVSINSPSHYEMTTASSDTIYLDSNHLWAVRNPVTTYAEGFATSKIRSEKLLCFDSVNRFCAISQ